MWPPRPEPLAQREAEEPSSRSERRTTHEQIGSLPAGQARGAEDVACGESFAGTRRERVEVGPDDFSKVREVGRSVLLHGVAGVVVPLNRGQDGEARSFDTQVEASGA